MSHDPETSFGDFLEDDLVADPSTGQTKPPPAAAAAAGLPAMTKPLALQRTTPANPAPEGHRISRDATPIAAPQQLQALKQHAEMSQQATANSYDWLSQKTGVVGVAQSLASGEMAHASGGASTTFAEQMAYFRQVSQVIGLELGFENLRELHVGSRDARHVSVQLDDASCVHVIATGLGNTHELARLIRERQQ